MYDHQRVMKGSRAISSEEKDMRGKSLAISVQVMCSAVRLGNIGGVQGEPGALAAWRVSLGFTLTWLRI